MNGSMLKHGTAVLAIAMFLATVVVPAGGGLGVVSLRPADGDGQAIEHNQDIELPEPQHLDLSLEVAMARRKSVRMFTEETVSQETLSTILWHAYGFVNGQKRAVHPLDGYAAHLYVLTGDAVYRYDPSAHVLRFHLNGDYRHIGQYEAPLQLAVTWNESRGADEHLGAAEIGAIGQNIQFAANILGLGTVVTAGSGFSQLEIPPAERGRIIMPLGHPRHSYDFTYQPGLRLLLPAIRNASMTLTEAVEQRREATSFSGSLSRQELSQLLWSAYGFSYNIDEAQTERNNIVRHRTVPSAHGYYPLKIYVVTADGVYRYLPGLYRYYMWDLPVVHGLIPLRTGDFREGVAEASSMEDIGSAPAILVSTLNIQMTEGMIGLPDDLSDERFRWLWYYEAGAAAHNVLLEATAWGCTANVALPQDGDHLRSILRVTDNQLPLLIMPVGEA